MTAKPEQYDICPDRCPYWTCNCCFLHNCQNPKSIRYLIDNPKERNMTAKPVTKPQGE